MIFFVYQKMTSLYLSPDLFSKSNILFPLSLILLRTNIKPHYKINPKHDGMQNKVSETPMMDGNGKLYESKVILALLFNSESWIEITDTHIPDLQNFQDKFVRKLLRMPPSTPKDIIHWDSGLKLMKWRIAKKKLLF